MLCVNSSITVTGGTLVTLGTVFVPNFPIPLYAVA